MSILARLLLLVGLALAPISAVEIWNQIDLRHDREAEVYRTALHLLGLLGGEQRRLVEGVRNTLSLLAETRAARELNGGVCQGLLERTRPQLPDYLTIYLARLDGAVLCSTDKSLSGTTLSENTHVRDALERDSFTVGEFTRNRSTGKPAVPFTLPIHGDDGTMVGVVTALIDLGWLGGYLAEHPLPPNAVILLSDGNGVVLAHVPDRPGLVGTTLPDRFRPLIDAKAIGTAQVMGIDGTLRVFAYEPITINVRQTFVAIGFDHAAAMADVDETMRRSLLWIATALMLSLLGALLLARRPIHRPVEALVETTKRWRSGQLSARAGLPDDGSELGQLGQAFDRMAEDLEAQIRAREATAAALQVSEARHRAIVETAVDAMVVIDEQGSIQSCNPAAERIFGYTEAELLERNVTTLMPEPFHAEHDGYIGAFLRSGVRKMIGSGREVQGRRKDGSTFPLELAVAEWTVGGQRYFTGIMRDITRRWVAEEALRTSEERFRALVEDAPHMMWVNHPDGTLEFVNAAFRAYTGRRTTEDTRMNDVHPDDVERIQAERRRAIAAGEPHEYELRLRRADGAYRWHLSRTHPVHQGGRIIAWFGGAVDIHDIHRAREVAEEADRSKSRFLAAASHDLRQPMQSILLFAETLRPHLTEPAAQDKLKRLLHGLDVMKGLLDGLLDISRLDAGIVAPQFEVFRAADVLEPLNDAYAPIARGKGVEWRAMPCGATVRSDRVLLGRMLRNLIENAVRYTDSGQIVIDCTAQEDRLLIEVCDTGIGIPADHLTRIFEEFHQVGNAERDRSQGLGLGLAIVRRLSRLLDHPVEVRSEPGRGSRFSVAVPLATEEAEPASSPDGAPETLSAAGEERPFAVVVDDDAIVLMGLDTMLREWGYDVLIAGSTDQALEKLRSDPRRPDILIVDYRLREGRVGTEAILRARQMYGRKLPGIIITGEIGAEPQHDAIAHGLGLLHKPVTPRLLEVALARQMRAAE
ncbi:PAS domain S-box protein [Azospirillum soli]|uniref:PAS domain S-box protein n=1 Tax=Azospirillum soli TaxID=1304799 RepID=UPI001AEB9CE9|nr:PAS domain S-box protein [Azospirillum soli]MBP2312831.1 PAS domain S-box-containing protein [Azospirillum soli]